MEYTKDYWSKDELIDSWSCVDMIWNHPYPYGLDGTKAYIKPERFISDDSYGKRIFFKNQVVDDIDYVARSIYATIIDDPPRVDNAFKLAQTIENGMKKYNLSAREVIDNTLKVNKRAFLWPSRFGNKITSDSRDNVTKELLFVQCCYLASVLVQDGTIPNRREDGLQVYSDVP